MLNDSLHEGLITWFHRRAQSDSHETWLRNLPMEELPTIEREVEALYTHLQFAITTYAATHQPLSKGTLLYALKLLLYATYDGEAADIRQEVLARYLREERTDA